MLGSSRAQQQPAGAAAQAERAAASNSPAPGTPRIGAAPILYPVRTPVVADRSPHRETACSELYGAALSVLLPNHSAVPPISSPCACVQMRHLGKYSSARVGCCQSKVDSSQVAR